MWEVPFAGASVEVEGFPAIKDERGGLVSQDRLTGDRVARHGPGRARDSVHSLRSQAGRPVRARRQGAAPDPTAASPTVEKRANARGGNVARPGEESPGRALQGKARPCYRRR